MVFSELTGLEKLRGMRFIGGNMNLAQGTAQCALGRGSHGSRVLIPPGVPLLDLALEFPII